MPESHKYGRTQAFKNFKKRPGTVLNCKKKHNYVEQVELYPDIALWPFTVLTFVIRAQAVTSFKDFAKVM
jgi:hypothetical protein